MASLLIVVDRDVIARLDLRPAPQVFGIDLLESLESYLRNAHIDGLVHRHALSPCDVLRRGHGIAGQLVHDFACRLLTQRNRVGYAWEICSADVAHVHVDAEVLVRQRGKLDVLVRLEHHFHAARKQLRSLDQLLRGCRRLDQVHDNDDVRTCLTGDIDGNVPDLASIGQDVVLEDHGRECPRNGHACAHRRREVAFLEHDHVAGHHVGSNRAIRNRKPVEIGNRAGLGYVGPEQVVDGTGVGEPGGSHELAMLHAQREIRACRHLEALLLDGLERPAADAADDKVPVDARYEGFELCGGHPRRITTSDQRAHARAGDAVDRHVLLFEYLDYADVRAALRAAAGEHQTDARTVYRCCGDLFRGGGSLVCADGRRAETYDQTQSERNCAGPT